MKHNLISVDPAAPDTRDYTVLVCPRCRARTAFTDLQVDEVRECLNCTFDELTENEHIQE